MIKILRANLGSLDVGLASCLGSRKISPSVFQSVNVGTAAARHVRD